MPRLPAQTRSVTRGSEREARWPWTPSCAAPALRPGSPFSLCWKEGENSLAVILAIRASSWAF